MCGIVGLVGLGKLNKKEEVIRQEAMIFLMTELLLLTLSRGKDATGLATLMENGQYMGLKMGIPSPDFVARFGGTEKDYDGFLSIWRKSGNSAKIALGHCRKGTIGDKEDNENNHPIKVGEVIGVHNGEIKNHKQIFENGNFKRDGEVDSESIFRLLHYYTKNGKDPFTPEIMLETARRLDGQYAVMAMSGNNPFQLAMMRDGRPVEFALVKPLNLLVVASEKKFLDTALFKMNKQSYLFGRKDFPKLKKSDVEFHMMKDDSCAIFDVRKDVTSETRIEDLFIGERIPRTDKIWKVGTATTGYNYNNKNTNYNSINKSEVDATPKNGLADDDNAGTTKLTTGAVADGKNKKDKSKVGMIWNKTLHKYDRTSVNAKTKNTVGTAGSMEVDTESGKVERVDKINDDQKSMPEVSLKAVDKPKAGSEHTYPAKVNEIDTSGIDTSDKDEKTDENIRALETTEVIVKTNPEAIEAAEDAVKRMNKFSNENEAAVNLEISDVKSLMTLPLHSLCNRISKIVFKRGFITGYEFRDAKLLEGDDDKIKKAQHGVYVLKLINKILSIASSKKLTLFEINNATDEVFCNHGLLKTEDFDKVFREGDTRNNENLGLVRTSIGEKQSRNTKEE
jgi:hypothetical protein